MVGIADGVGERLVVEIGQFVRDRHRIGAVDVELRVIGLQVLRHRARVAVPRPKPAP